MGSPAAKVDKRIKAGRSEIHKCVGRLDRRFHAICFDDRDQFGKTGIGPANYSQ